MTATDAMPILGINQPHATLLADPDLPKTIIDRPKPWPSTLPLGESGRWVLVHATKSIPLPCLITDADGVDGFLAYGREPVWELDYVKISYEGRSDMCEEIFAEWLPLGAVIGAAHITASLPILSGTAVCDVPCIILGEWEKRGYPGHTGHPIYPELVLCESPDGDGVDISADLPYGDYDLSKGPRWGWLTDRTILLPTPIPHRGRQWPADRATPELMAAVAAQLGEGWDR